MAGQELHMLTGGAGYATPVSSVAPSTGNGGIAANLAAGVQPHHGPIALVLIAVAVLFILDRAGFRFAVTAGRR